MSSLPFLGFGLGPISSLVTPLLGALVALLAEEPNLSAGQLAGGETGQSHSHDFDFFVGNWAVHHKRLKERLSGCTEWVQFGGTCATQTILGGLGNIDDNVIAIPTGTYRAITLRSYDPATNHWSIWWLDGRSPGRLDTPVVGKFSNGVGAFYTDDTYNGKPIRVRFLWSKTNSASPRWEQAFSADGGKNWENNWEMDFTRAKA